MKFSTALGLSLVSGASGFATGSGTCSHKMDSITGMTTGGRVKNMDAGGFTFSGIPVTGYVPGTEYTITMGAAGKMIKGLLAYAVDTTEATPESATRVGTIAAGSGADEKGDCTEGATATHTGGDGAATKSFKWTAPDGPDSVTFHGIAYEGLNFWQPTPFVVIKDATGVVVGGDCTTVGTVMTCNSGTADCTGMTVCTCTGTATCNGGDSPLVSCAGTGDCNCGTGAGSDPLMAGMGNLAKTCTCTNSGKCCKDTFPGTFLNTAGASTTGCGGGTIVITPSEGSSLAASAASVAVGAIAALFL